MGIAPANFFTQRRISACAKSSESRRNQDIAIVVYTTKNNIFFEEVSYF